MIRHSWLVIVVLLFGLACAPPPEKTAEPHAADPGLATSHPEVGGTVDLDEGEAKYDAAKAAFEEDETDETKEAYTSAAVDLALAVMDSGLPPNQMYPRALGLFRDVLEVDPENVPAQEWIATIEGIYASMGRPVPEPAEDGS